MNEKMQKLIDEMDEQLEFAYENGLLKRPEEEKEEEEEYNWAKESGDIDYEKEDLRKENQESSY